MKKLLFIRHGESEANKLGMCAGHADVALTEFGREQATIAGQRLKESHAHVDVIISSPLIRAYETAQIIAGQIGYPVELIEKTDLAMERFRGDLEGKPSSLQADMTPEEFVGHGAESEASMGERAEKLTALLQARPEGTVLLVAHNQFGMRFISYFECIPLKSMRKLPNAQVIELTQNTLA